MALKRFVQSRASEYRLEKLIASRLVEGADRTAIDERIWNLFGEEWCVMFTDLAGFSRNVARYGIIHFLQTIYESQRLLIPIIDQHDGILLKTEGDSFLVLFRKADRGLVCAQEMQSVLREYNQSHAPEDQIHLCVGLGYGPMLKIGDLDVFGAEVNAASKLGEDTAGPGEIIVTESLRQALDPDLAAAIPLQKLDVQPPGASGAWLLPADLTTPDING
ncbi:MAG: adenylate/guanylate cyclase domain-containing protein [Leptospiraceae bacterium]|nr:adenylate/guanylate cyclase domain-containing protein [Leptospiraceae bacterium]